MSDFEIEFRESVNGLGRRLVISRKAPKNIHDVLANEAFSSVLLKHWHDADLSWLVDYKGQINHLQIFGDACDWESINTLENLRAIELNYIVGASLDLGRLTNLRYLDGCWGSGFEEILNNPSGLETLLLHNYNKQDLSAFAKQAKLHNLKLIGAKQLVSLDGVQALEELRFLEFYSSPKLADISAVRGHPHLDALILETCKRIHRIPANSDIYIRELLIDSDAIESLHPLKKWSNLEILTFVCKVEDGDTEILKTFKKLKFAIFQNKRGLNAKVKDIAEYLQSQGYDQEALRASRKRFPGSDIYRRM